MKIIDANTLFVDEIINVFRENRTVWIAFVKYNGTMREADATLWSDNYFPYPGTFDLKTVTMIRFLDIGLYQWRNFKVSNLKLMGIYNS